jgi:hypothetical protein
MTAGSNFGVSRYGKIYSTGGTIGGWNITQDEIGAERVKLYSGNDITKKAYSLDQNTL